MTDWILIVEDKEEDKKQIVKVVKKVFDASWSIVHAKTFTSAEKSLKNTPTAPFLIILDINLKGPKKPDEKVPSGISLIPTINNLRSERNWAKLPPIIVVSAQYQDPRAMADVFEILDKSTGDYRKKLEEILVVIKQNY